MTTRIKVMLVDASGSMRPAWTAAWRHMFDATVENLTPFLLFMFREAGTLGPQELHLLRHPAALRGRHAVVVNVAHFIRNLAGGSLVREPPRPPLAFRGYTPLNDAVATLFREFRGTLDSWDTSYELHVFSDNRGSYAAGRDIPKEEALKAKRQLRRLRAVVWHPVGVDPLFRHLDLYDYVDVGGRLVPVSEFHPGLMAGQAGQGQAQAPRGRVGVATA